MRAPDATRSANFAAGMGFALVTAVGWGLNWPVPKYLLAELPLGPGRRSGRSLFLSALGVRRDKAALSSGCKSHPANAPAGSSRSSYGGDEVAEAFGKRVTNW